MPAWPLSGPPADFVLGHVRAVLPGRVVDDARVVVRDHRIADVGPHPPGSAADVDGGGLHLVPGLVDVHSDTLGRESRPRPGASLDPALALAATASRLRASGVTTAFHGLAFQARTAVGTPVESPRAHEHLDAIRAGGHDQVDHRVLHRLDVRCPTGRAELEACLARSWADGEVPLVSHEDHTPGQGQYAEPATMVRWLVEAEQMTEPDAVAHVHDWRETRELAAEVARESLAWLGALAHRGRIRLAGHDPADAADVEAIVARAGTVAEFPTTRAAAVAAVEAGLHVVVGAPNVLRGRSHAGNVSAAELVVAGLADALTSDYLPTALLPSAVRLAGVGGLGLARAVALVTAGPAAAAGLRDRGRLEPGLRADLVLTDLDRPTAPVRAVLVGPR